MPEEELMEMPAECVSGGGEGDDEGAVRLDLGEVHLRALGQRRAAQHGGARRRHQLERGGRAQHGVGAAGGGAHRLAEARLRSAVGASAAYPDGSGRHCAVRVPALCRVLDEAVALPRIEVGERPL